MVLLISLHYPSPSQRQEFAQNTPDSYKPQRGHHPSLLAETDNEQWKTTVQIIRQNMADKESESMLQDKSVARPVRPGFDNYGAFKGTSWNPKSSPMEMRGLPSPHAALAAFGGTNREDTRTHAHYDRCANCTQAATRRCSRCKIVKYCSRECQSSHWKTVHKASCIEARSGVSLAELLDWDNGLHKEFHALHILPEECRALHTALSLQQQGEDISGATEDGGAVSDGLKSYFGTFFGLAAELGGCFAV